MLLWFAGLSFVMVWNVFRDPAIDYRLVMVGALLPDVVDAPFGGPRVMHSVTAAVAEFKRRHRVADRRAWRAEPPPGPLQLDLAV